MLVSGSGKGADKKYMSEDGDSGGIRISLSSPLSVLVSFSFSFFCLFFTFHGVGEYTCIQAESKAFLVLGSLNEF